MAIDPEEWKQRRLQRQQQRQKQQRRTVVKLVVAGLFLVLCAALIFALTRQTPNATSPSDHMTGQTTLDTHTDTVPNPTATGTEQTEPATTVIHLAAAGDLNVTEAAVASGGDGYDYTDTFVDVLPTLAQADITTLNLEGNLFGPPYGTDRSAPPELLEALRRAGVDLIQLANSFSIYKGIDGLTQTIAGVRSAGMEPLGVYATAAEARAGKGYTIRNVKGIRIAFIAFTKGMDGMALPPGSDGCVNLLYTDYASDYQEVDTQGITDILEAAEKAAPDLTVALLHWGSEFNDTISKSQNEICTLLQEHGVDAIIGTHSHYVQKMVYDEAAGTFIAYSLGDFLGDAARAGSEYSVILDLEITKDHASGDTRITNYTYTPIFIRAEEERPLKVLRLTDAIRSYESGYIDRVSSQTYEAMKYALTRIEARIKAE